MPSSKPSPQRSEIYVENEAETLLRADDLEMDDSKKRVFQDGTHVNSQRLCQHVQGLYRFKTDGFPVSRGESKQVLPPYLWYCGYL